MTVTITIVLKLTKENRIISIAERLAATFGRLKSRRITESFRVDGS